MITPHPRLGILALFLIFISLFVPKTADTKEEYRVTSVGYPIPFIQQNNVGYLGYNELYPRTYLFSIPQETPTDLLWDKFFLSWLITFCVLECLWFLSQQSIQKHARLIFISSMLVASIASVILLNTYEEKRKQQEEALQQARLTTIANDTFGITVRYDEQLLTLESNTESSLHFSSPLGRIDIQQTPSTDSFLELSSPDDTHPLQGFMMLERFDQQGITGYKRWDIATQSSDSPSRIVYRFYLGDSLLEITTIVNAPDPESVDFEALEKTADELVRNIHFADGVDVPDRTISKTWVAYIDPDVVSNSISLNTTMNYSVIMKGKTDPESTTVANADLGIGLAYNPTIFSVKENTRASDLGAPTLKLQSDLLRVTFQETALKEFASIQQPQLRSPIPLERVMMIARYDRAGFAGYRQWDWIVQNQDYVSVIIYRFHRGSDALEIQGWINEIIPTSERFHEAENQLELLVENMWFEGRDEKTRSTIQKDFFPAVTENLIIP